MVGGGLGVGSFRSCFYDFSQAGLEECSAPGQRSLRLGQGFPDPRPVSLQPSALAGGNRLHSWAWEAAVLRGLFPRLMLAPAMLAVQLTSACRTPGLPTARGTALPPLPHSLSLELQLPQSLRPSAQLFHSSILRLHLAPFLPEAWEFSQGRELGSERPLDVSVALGSLSLPADVRRPRHHCSMALCLFCFVLVFCWLLQAAG